MIAGGQRNSVDTPVFVLSVVGTVQWKCWTVRLACAGWWFLRSRRIVCLSCRTIRPMVQNPDLCCFNFFRFQIWNLDDEYSHDVDAKQNAMLRSWQLKCYINMHRLDNPCIEQEKLGAGCDVKRSIRFDKEEVKHNWESTLYSWHALWHYANAQKG